VGTMAMLACRAGAAKVHAIEVSSAITIAAALAKANGFADRIVCHQVDALEFQPSEPIDVIIGDLRGALPLFRGNLETMAHARRWLRPGGELIPRHDTLRCALVANAEEYESITRIWTDRRYGLDLSGALPWMLNRWTKVALDAEHLIGAAQSFATVRYGEPASELHGKLTWPLDRNCTAHGFALWFDAQLIDGVGFSNAPGEPRTIYGQAFFPFHSPLTLTSGDIVELALTARPGRDWAWTWRTRVTNAGTEKLAYTQSTLLGEPVGLARLENTRSASPERSHIEPSSRTAMYTVSTEVLTQTVGDDLVLLDLKSSNYYYLNPVGVEVWSLLKEGRTADQIISTLLPSFEVEEAVLRADVNAVLRNLLSAGLIAEA
jgi:type I protein arginine methyltransferase